MKKIDEFNKERDRLNEIVMKYAGLGLKRFLSLDNQFYTEGALPAKTKEMLGLISSFVLRCDDCINYHLDKCNQLGVTNEEMEELLAIGVLIGGSITIPHLRRALEVWDDMRDVA
ncbi:MAG TPA: carboxymuconolactone decarboxylase family protein [Candidatus Cloacimonadota bacterium]|nr:carboxymuconolactone decarboxylase family protein [Candidatus Cloacimonadota bacterium]HPT72902.1 carboxymuconolactone decarboxylase family protein [Candidatus Cloacimonadota bacterium]